MSDGDKSRDLVRIIVDETLAFSAPIIGAATNPWQRAQLMRSLGWDLLAISGYDAVAFENWLKAVWTAAQDVAALVEGGIPTSFAGIKEVGKLAQEAAKAGTSLPPALKGQLPPDLDPKVLGEDLLTFLTVNRLHRASPGAYRGAILLGLITPAGDNAPSAPVPGDGTKPPIRLPRRRDSVELARIPKLVTDPVKTLKEIYAPNGIPDANAADATAALLFPRVAALLREIGIPARYGVEPGVGPDLGAAGEMLAGNMLSIHGVVSHGMVRVPLGVTIGISSPDRGGLGVILSPEAALQLSTVVGRWGFQLDVDGDVPLAIAIRSDGIQFVGGQAAIRVGGTITRLPDQTGHALRLGPADGTHLAVGQLALRAFGSLGTGRDDFGAAIRAGAAEMVIKAGDGDAFLKRVLPAEGLKAAFELGVGWSRRGGLVIEGGLGMAATLPLHLNLGPLKLLGLYLALEASVQAERVSAVAALNAKLELGTIVGTVERIGIKADVTFPDTGGNLGAAHITPSFKAPDGIGLTFNKAVVKGGGYLFIDEPKGQYAGALQLGWSDFSIAALGLLNTKLPDGKPIVDSAGREAWSLLIVAAAKWKPVHIAFGVHISGAGVIVGIHRTVDTAALREGVRTKALDAVLFPPDPVGNAPQMIATLGKLFPVAPDRHTFGLMAQFTWGPGKWLTLDLGLMLELPAPLRLIVLGRVALTLPRPEAEDKPGPQIVKLRLDAVGILDFDRKEFSLDAAFVDSTIARMALTGEMAVRAAWGDKPGFALSAGGFHPRFTPPPGFPALKRIALAIAGGENPRLVLEAYFAVTSNTIQLGARLVLHAEALGFAIDGVLSFDALITFSPFGFEIQLYALVSLKRGSTELMAIELALKLAGPEPWLARGYARFKLWFINGSIPVEIGSKEALPPPPPTPPDPKGQLQQALAEAGSWTVQPPMGSAGVVLRAVEPPAGELLVHPLGRVGVQQSVLPLNVTITRLGAAALPQPAKFTIARATFDGVEADEYEPILDSFAPGEFFDLTDDQKLSRPDFDRLESGRRFGSAKPKVPPVAQTTFAAATYETSILDAPDEPARKVKPQTLSPQMMAAAIGTAPAVVAAGRAVTPERFVVQAASVTLDDPEYAVVDGIPVTDGARFTVAMEALNALDGDRDGARLVPKLAGGVR